MTDCVMEEMLSQICDRARVKWPNLSAIERLVLQHLVRLELTQDQLQANGPDLVLATAVVEGDRCALQAFDQLLADASQAVGRVDRSPAFVDDVRQELRIELLTGPSPGIERYAARGALVDWLRVSALRTALNLKRSDRLNPVAELPLAATLGRADDAPLSQVYLNELNQALESSFHRLSARHRTLLRFYFVDGLRIERIGIIYGVHRATVARWMATIRQKLFDDVAVQLARTHGFSPADVRSIYRHLERDVHVTISRVLGAESRQSTDQ